MLIIHKWQFLKIPVRHGTSSSWNGTRLVRDRLAMTSACLAAPDQECDVMDRRCSSSPTLEVHPSAAWPGAPRQYLRYALGLPAMSRSASTISLTSCCSEVF